MQTKLYFINCVNIRFSLKNFSVRAKYIKQHNIRVISIGTECFLKKALS